MDSVDKFAELIRNLPTTTKELDIWSANDKFLADALPPVIQATARFVNWEEDLKDFCIYWTNVGDSKESSAAIQMLT